MINGRMSEAVNEVAPLEDVEMETFVRFIQWAYTGSYNFERNGNNNNNKKNNNDLGANHNEFREATAEEMVDKLYEFEENAMWQQNPLILESTPIRKYQNFQRRARNKKSGYAEEDWFSRSPLENLRKAFLERDYPVVESSLLVEPSPSSYNNNNNNNNREHRPDLFLPHAKLFVFAEKYDIQPLKLRTIHNLHHALCHNQPFLPQHVSDITNLIHYSYENTHHASGDSLRELLASYVELEMAVLIEAKPFEELLEEGGDFVGDFLKRVKKRIS